LKTLSENAFIFKVLVHAQPCCLLVRTAYLSGRSLRFAGARLFDRFAARFLLQFWLT